MRSSSLEIPRFLLYSNWHFTFIQFLFYASQSAAVFRRSLKYLTTNCLHSNQEFKYRDWFKQRKRNLILFKKNQVGQKDSLTGFYCHGTDLTRQLRPRVKQTWFCKYHMSNFHWREIIFLIVLITFYVMKYKVSCTILFPELWNLNLVYHLQYG